MTPLEIMKKFATTKWFAPTVARHRLHVEMCEELDCRELIEPFFRFVREVIDAPNDACRADMLAVSELEPYEAFQRYPAYIEPTKQEQKLELYGAEMGRKLR